VVLDAVVTDKFLLVELVGLILDFCLFVQNSGALWYKIPLSFRTVLMLGQLV